MKEEEKELLLKDLCARLPYGVMVKTSYNDAITDKQTYPIRYIKPYLRSMSSMTKEERNHWKRISIGCPDWDFTARALDWLNSRHFDYRGLIEKGLAIEATNDIYKD